MPSGLALNGTVTSNNAFAANQLGRRNLTPSQKAALALELEKQFAAEAKKRQRLNNANRIILSESEKGRARDKAAEMIGASPAYVQDAKQIERDAPEILHRNRAALRCNRKCESL